jgi:beta-N-acetylhexosaminidase
MSLGPLMIDIGGTNLEAGDRELLLHPLVGGLILFTRNYSSRDQVRELVSEIQALRAASEALQPLLIAVDQEGGRVQRFREGFYSLPPLRWLGHLYDEDPALAREMAMCAARVMAVELLDTGIDFSFAPVIDLDWGNSEVIGNRSLHRQAEVVGELGLAYMQGMRQAGMAAVAKHFPGHGAVTADSHHALPVDHRSQSELLEDMQPYSSLIGDGLRGIMMAHIRYPEIEPQIASLSEFWMQSVLRNELNYHGAIFSDDMCMAGASEGGTVAERVQTALEAGADMALICNEREAVAPALELLSGYAKPVSHVRLAAMRASREHYESAPYRSDGWQRDIERLEQVRQAQPTLELEGNV